jgi:RNA polymerase sigma-70 factor (ECF subfamily)
MAASRQCLDKGLVDEDVIDQEAQLVAAFRSDDQSTFAEQVRHHRRALHVHCYRMLGSLDDAEDVVQETLLRAWRQRHHFEGRSPFRAWLYRIATNACIDSMRRDQRRVLPHHVAPANVPPDELPSTLDPRWLQPYPDQLLDELQANGDDPEAEAVARETIELTYIAALQLLTPPQRAVLLVRDVLGWSAAETAALLEMSVASVNSALQRARATVQRNRPSDRLEWTTSFASATEDDLLQRLMRASERADAEAIVELLSPDARWSMPPYPWWFDGLDAVARSVRQGLGENNPGEWRVVQVRANRQPGCAAYVRRWHDDTYRAFAVNVIRIEGNAIAEVTGFHDPRLFAAFGLPPNL